MTPSSVVERERLPRNWFERLLWLHGRKFYLAMYAGASTLLVAVSGMACVALLGRFDASSVEFARVVEAIVTAYFFSVASIVTAYSASNAAVERAHAKRPEAGAAPVPPPARPSGVVEASDG